MNFTEIILCAQDTSSEDLFNNMENWKLVSNIIILYYQPNNYKKLI